MALLAIAATVANLGANLFGAVSRRRAADRNYRFASQMADDVIARGEREAEFATMDLARLRGAQQTSFGAQGIDPTMGTAAQIAQQTEQFGQQDIEQIRLNAAREAWGIRTQARLNRTGERNAAFAQGLGAVGQFVADPMGRELLQGAGGVAMGAGRAAARAGRTLLTRVRTGWEMYNTRRQLKQEVGNWMTAAKRGQ